MVAITILQQWCEANPDVDCVGKAPASRRTIENKGYDTSVMLIMSYDWSVAPPSRVANLLDACSGT
jgi:hypothetical protein